MKRLGAVFTCLLLCLSMADSKSAFQITPPSQPIPAAYFGMHIHNVIAPSRTGARTPWPSLPVPTWRLWDSQVTWADIEPNKGQWKFDLLDKYLALADAHQAEILLPLGVTPQWASSQPDVKSGCGRRLNVLTPRNLPAKSCSTYRFIPVTTATTAIRNMTPIVTPSSVKALLSF